jgi:diguanylate cyclase
MKESFYKIVPIIFIIMCIGIWLLAFLFYERLGLITILVGGIISQLLLFLYCGIIIRKLHQQAGIDSLTGICNRKVFFLKTSRALKLRLPVSMMMIDVDHFKRLNDTHGHFAGDELLKQIAESLKRSTRTTDLIARLGGDEFAVVMPETSRENALKVAERIRQSIAGQAFSLYSASEKVTISIGISTTELPIDITCFLNNADKALYQAKITRNTVVAYDEDFDHEKSCKI